MDGALPSSPQASSYRLDRCPSSRVWAHAGREPSSFSPVSHARGSQGSRLFSDCLRRQDPREGPPTFPNGLKFCFLGGSLKG